MSRAELFRGHRDKNATDSETKALLAENNSINASINMVDDLLHRSAAAGDDLLHQRNVFVSTRRKLQQLGTRFPTIGSLIGSIQRRQNRETIILAFVIACCLFTIIVYKLG